MQPHDPGPALMTSFSVFPALKVDDVDADTETASPVLGLRPIRAGLLLALGAKCTESRYPNLLAIGESIADGREHSVYRFSGDRLAQAGPAVSRSAITTQFNNQPFVGRVNHAYPLVTYTH